jgi:antitoxin component YwqK of YwqJK toxin-antitoxin module
MSINHFKWVIAVLVLSLGLIVGLTQLSSLESPLIVDKSEVTINKQGQRVYQNVPLSGEMISFFDSGKQATADQFVNGRRQGYAKKWFENTTLAYEANYLAGVRHGVSQSWWRNGNLRSKFFYISGKTEGAGWHWYRSGAKFKKFNYQAGQPIGLQQAWRENGKLSSNFEYKNGRTYGLKKSNSCVGLEDEVLSLDYYQAQANNTLSTNIL